MPHKRGTGELVLQRKTSVPQCGVRGEHSILKDGQFKMAGARSSGTRLDGQKKIHWNQK